MILYLLLLSAYKEILRFTIIVYLIFYFIIDHLVKKQKCLLVWKAGN